MATKDAAVTAKSATVKAKKASSTTTKAKAPSTHPKYHEMIEEAITSLKERTGSSQYAIAKFIEEHHKSLPANFKKHLLVQLKRLVASNSLTKVKNSYKLTPNAVKKPAVKKPAVKKPAPKKVKSVKSATKAKPAAKPKAVKAKPAAKPKAVKKAETVKKAVVKKVAPAKRKAAPVKSKKVKTPVKEAKK